MTNVLGTFESLQTTPPTLASDIKRVWTTGRSVEGRFPGVYILYHQDWADDEFDPEEWEEICFTDADDRVFVFDYKNTDLYPGHFGVLGVSTSDDHIAMSRYCEFCCTFASRAYLDGTCYLSEKLYFGLAGGVDSRTMVYRGGRMDFRALPTVEDFEIDQLVHMRNMKDVSFEGRMRFFGGGSSSAYVTQGGVGYVDRLHVGCGLWLDDCRGAHFRYLYFSRFWWGGVASQRRNLENDENSQNNNVKIDKIEGQWVGSGDTDPHANVDDDDSDSQIDDPIQSLIANFTCLASPARDSGGASNTNQRSQIIVTDLSKLPPANLHGSGQDDLGMTTGNNPVIAFINDQPHRVTSIDRDTGAVNLYPWMDQAVPAYDNDPVGEVGEVYFAWGGLIVIQGGDANLWEIGMIDGRLIGIGMAVRSNQGPIVNQMTIQNDCGIGVLIGDTIEGSDQGNGTSIMGFYMEGPENHLLIISDAASPECSGSLYDTYTHDWSHADDETYKTIHAPRDASYAPTDRVIWNWAIDVEGVRHLAKRHPAPSGTHRIDTPQDLEICRSDGPTWTLDNDSRITRLFDYDRQLLLVHGTGTLGEPTGTITFNAPANGTVNGGNSATWTALQGPALFVLYEDSSDVWFVDLVAGRQRSGRVGVTTVTTDADQTLFSSAYTSRIYSGTLTANRTLTLPAADIVNGHEFHITRTGGGAFNLSVGSLKNLAANTWCIVRYDGSAWKLMAYGAL